MASPGGVPVDTRRRRPDLAARRKGRVGHVGVGRGGRQARGDRLRHVAHDGDDRGDTACRHRHRQVAAGEQTSGAEVEPRDRALAVADGVGVDHGAAVVGEPAVDRGPHRDVRRREPRARTPRRRRRRESRRRAASTRRSAARRRALAAPGASSAASTRLAAFQPTQLPNTASHTTIPVPFTQARLQLVAVVVVPSSGVVHHVPPLVPVRPQHARAPGCRPSTAPSSPGGRRCVRPIPAIRPRAPVAERAPPAPPAARRRRRSSCRGRRRRPRRRQRATPGVGDVRRRHRSRCPTGCSPRTRARRVAGRRPTRSASPGTSR